MAVSPDEVRDPPTILPPGAGEPATNYDLSPDPPGDATPVCASPAPERREVPFRLGNYDVLEVIARGGMGIVYKARDARLNRVVALKMVLAGQLGSPTALARFRNEALAARLDHPGIVPIFEIGEADGQPFYVMQYVNGGSLQQALNNSPLTGKAAAHVIREAALAVQHAHENGVIHRDLKPQNILLRRTAGNTCVGLVPSGTGSTAGSADLENGAAVPVVADFGLASAAEGSKLTGSGEPLGTPSYMPPEQAAGETERVGPASDVYSLGAVLYDTLTGRPPFQSASIYETLRQVRSEEPVPPRRLNSAVPRDLETICLKCLHKDPARRYSAAADLAADLERFLRGEAIHARPVGRPERLVRWCRRYPGAASLTGAVLLLLTLMAVGATAAAVLINGARRRAEQAQLKAERHFDKTLEMADSLTQVALETLDYTPHMEDRQLDLLELTQKQLAELLQDRPNDLKVRKKLALVNQSMGTIWARHDKDRQAIESYTWAVRAFAQLAEDDPDNALFYRQHQAVCFNGLGVVLQTTNPAGARAYYDDALKIQRALAAASAAPVQREELACTLGDLGILLDQSGHAEEADRTYAETIQLFRDLGDAKPSNQAGLARACNNRGGLQEARGKTTDAEASYREAIGLLAPLTEHYPARYQYRYKLATTRSNLAHLLAQPPETLGNILGLLEAESLIDRSIEQLRRLVSDFPVNLRFQKELANVRNTQALILWYEGRRQDTQRTLEEALPLFQSLVEKNPNVHEYQSKLGMCEGFLGYVYLERSRQSPDTAKADLKRARELLTDAAVHQREVRRLNPDEREYRERLAGHCRTLAEILTLSGDLNAARALRQEADQLDAPGR